MHLCHITACHPHPHPSVHGPPQKKKEEKREENKGLSFCGNSCPAVLVSMLLVLQSPPFFGAILIESSVLKLNPISQVETLRG